MDFEKQLSDIENKIKELEDFAKSKNVDLSAFGINLDDIRLGDTARIKENLEVLPQVLKNAEAQGLRTFDVSGFLTKNVNLI